MKESFLRKLQVVASFALIASAPLVANAAYENADAARSNLQVSFADLNLDSQEGVEVLYRRLKSASSKVCGTGVYQQKSTVKSAVQARACFQSVLSRSVAKVGNANLTAIHES